MSKFPNAVVVTGSIGSGKSTFCTLLRERGHAVIDADSVAHEQLDICIDEIVREFGAEILASDLSSSLTGAFADSGKHLLKIDRKKLGAIVFSDSLKLERLEQILHPKIMAEIYKRAENLERLGQIYFVDIPLFFELGKAYEFEKVALVYAPSKTLIKRVMNRNLLDFDAASNRVNLQIDIEEKRKLADFIIDNSTDLANLVRETDKFLQTKNAGI